MTLEKAIETITNAVQTGDYTAERDRALATVQNACDIINRQKAEIERLQCVLQGVMLSVDKWLDGDELKQDEVNRAADMREKTLKIVESKDEVINAQSDKIRLLEQSLMNKQAEIEKLERNELKEAMTFNSDTIKRASNEAIKEFAERLKAKCHNYYPSIDSYCISRKAVELTDIYNLVKEMEVESNDRA